MDSRKTLLSTRQRIGAASNEMLDTSRGALRPSDPSGPSTDTVPAQATSLTRKASMLAAHTATMELTDDAVDMGIADMLDNGPFEVGDLDRDQSRTHTADLFNDPGPADKIQTLFAGSAA